MTKRTQILGRLKKLGSKRNRIGMARFGIEARHALGISIPKLRHLADEIGRDHKLALELWRNPIHEAKLLAIFIDDPAKVTEAQMDRWAKDFDSWDICDQCCGFLFDQTQYAFKKAIEWSKRREEFMKRAGFALMAALSVHDKSALDKAFVPFLVRIRDESFDERNFVRKAVNWALRQIGKRNAALNKKAVATAKTIGNFHSSSARWISSDALRELASKKVQDRLMRRTDPRR